MKLSINKTKASAIIVIALMIICIATVATDSAKAALTNVTGQAGVVAQANTTFPASTGYPLLGPLPSGVTPAYTIVQTAYIAVEPQTIGVNQVALIECWCSPGMYHAFYGEGYTVNIIKPDGTTETLGPVNSYQGDDTYWWDYVPDQVGTWQFQLNAPGTYLPATNYTDDATGQGFIGPANNQYLLGASIYYTPTTSIWFNVTVQQNYVQSWPAAALPGPGDYWTRPVNPMNREWWSIAGNYPFSGIVFYPNGNTMYAGNYKDTPYVIAPDSCHVVWMRANALSGIIGGWAGDSTVFGSPGTPSIIYDGRCYQTITKTMLMPINGTYVYEPTSVWECYDLRTGQVYWDQTGIVAPPTNIIYELGTSQPVPGAEANNGFAVSLLALTGNPNRIIEYNPLTGAVTLNITIPVNGVSSSYLYGDPYVVSLQTIGSGASAHYYLLNWTISGWAATTTFASKLLNNISWPIATLPGAGADWSAGIYGSGSWASVPGPQWCIGYQLTTYSMTTGALLVNETSNDTLTYNMQGTSFIMAHGEMALDAQNGHWNCWSATTGQLLWTSQQTISLYPWSSSTPDYPWGNWWAYYTSSYDINDTCSEIIACSYAGLFAFNWANGDILWHYYDNNTVPFESPYGGNSFFTGNIMADGKVYTYAGEHTPSEPIDRGWDTDCINATTGQQIWTIENTMVPGAVADGYLTAGNQDDGFMYVFGIGLSSTTVTAPLTAVTQGTPMVIQGTVLDQSPAQPNTPCVSDASMAQQMEYLHMQQPITGLWGNTTMTGVPVVITATDSSGNVINLGTATSNAYDGTFCFTWTPPSAGTYHISASFYGTDSYGSSSAGTNVVVTAAATSSTPTPTATPTPTPTVTTSNAVTANDLMLYVVGAAIAMIIAIAIATVLILRKK